MSKHARVGGPARLILAGAALALVTATVVAAQERTTDQLVRFHQSRVAADPDDPLAHNRLAAAYVQKARESGDLTYYGLAEQTARRSLQLLPSGPAAARATTVLAVVDLARHEFSQTLVHARAALDLNPDDGAPQAVAGDALVELGEYDQAAQAYARLATREGPRGPDSRVAYLKFLRGDLRGAIASMRQAVAVTAASNPVGEPVAWTRAQLGDLLFHAGELDGADAAYREALAATPGYHRALAGAARVRAARGRHGEAAELYRKALAVIPLPEYAAALGDVYTRMGRAEDARKQYALVEYIGRLSALNKTVYNRELALFYADHDQRLPEALELARRELEARRDVYTHDVLAWALYKNGRAREAQAAMTEALRLGTADARLFFHAGMIHRALGETDQARDALARALALNPKFHVLQAEVAARALSELGGRR
ncbi:MAG TPA: tetratricopeptide repeat protein [Patescibacteria group bacterium]|nr:tetratricopeptide repeat protein [Patescibacteria group bacterium]